MLIGKLNIPATKVYNKNAFDTETVEAHYLCIRIETYTIGEYPIRLEVKLGNIVANQLPAGITEYPEGWETEKFETVDRAAVNLTEQDASDWGTDDSHLLDLVASKYGRTIVEKIQKDNLIYTA